MKRVLVTGANGQLGMCIKDVAKENKTLEFIFTERAQLDITNESETLEFFKQVKPDYCINCAAYTAVDRAEEEPDKAFLVNATGPKNLALACKNIGTTLIHISTDYVFDGTKNTPYLETDPPNPINVYGKSKLEGERYIQEILPEHFIIRTSWLYSEYGSNFFKSIRRLIKEGKELMVVDDQIGTPTEASFLANYIVNFLCENKIKFGVYHLSNEGQTSWYNFAKIIVNAAADAHELKRIKSSKIQLTAKRPAYSVLDKSKIKKDNNHSIPNWKDSLLELLKV